MSEVFISYRRNDAGGYAGRLFDRLRLWFDEPALFYDMHSIDSGDVFPERLEDEVKGSKVVLVLIGPDWRDEINKRALLPATDFVRTEVELALQTNATNGTPKVIPVLLGGAKPPTLADLHETLQPGLRRLLSLNAHEFHGKNADWDEQFVRLRELIVSVPGVSPARYRPPVGTSKPFRITDHLLSPHFRDSAGALRRVREALLSGRNATSVVPVALHGMGGVGKTQLALKYSLDYRDSYAGVWWLRAETESTLQLDARDACAEVGARLSTGELPTIAFKRWLADQNDPWLLVFDNVARADAIRQHLPQTGPHHVLVTSRDPAWSGISNPVGLEIWSEEEGAGFLAQRLRAETGRGDLKRLSGVLGGLPLALEQAAAFLEETGAAVTDYCAGIESVDTAARLLGEGRASTGYEQSVLATLSLTFPRLNALAQRVLRICGYFSAEPIPERYFRDNAYLPEEFASVSREAFQWDLAVGELRRFRLVDRVEIASLAHVPGQTENLTEKALLFHRLTLHVVRQVLSQAVDDGPFAQRILWKYCLKEPSNPLNWRHFAALLPHLTQLDQFREQPWMDSTLQWHMLNTTAQYLCDAKGLYERSEEFHRRAEELARTRFGVADRFTLQSMSGRAEMLGHWDSAAARTLQEQVLEMQRRTLGEENDDTLSTENNLATTLMHAGDLDGAAALLRDVAEKRRRSLGEEHPNTLCAMHNLNNALWQKGERQSAWSLQLSVVSTCQRVLGTGHPHTLIALNSLSDMAAEMSVDPATVGSAQEKVLATCRRMLGDEHPTTLNAMHNLVETLWKQVDPKALSLQAELIAIYSRLRGEAHDDTIRARATLENLTTEQNEYQALQQRRHELGDNHPDTVAAMIAFADTLRERGNLPGARAIQEQVVEIQRTNLGGDNLETASSMFALAVTLWDLKDHEGAHSLLEQVLSIRRRELGEEHRDTASVMEGMVAFFVMQSEFDKARPLAEQVLTIRRRALGDEHTDTLNAMHDLAVVMWNQDREGATKWMARAAEGRAAKLGAEHPETKRSLGLLESMQTFNAKPSESRSQSSPEG